jgi:hypothetical protein
VVSIRVPNSYLELVNSNAFTQWSKPAENSKIVCSLKASDRMPFVCSVNLVFQRLVIVSHKISTPSSPALAINYNFGIGIMLVITFECPPFNSMSLGFNEFLSNCLSLKFCCSLSTFN